MWEIILISGVIIATAWQIGWWGLGVSRLLKYSNESYRKELKDVSVTIVMAARNERENVENFLPRILDQNYRSLTVIAVAHKCTDGTYEAMLSLKVNAHNLQLINAEKAPKRQHAGENDQGKKYALTKGIEAAASEWILLTDADCYPISKNWVSSMVKEIHPDTEVVLGYSPYEQCPGLLNKWIRFETVHTASQYFTFALWGAPYMGVGRNLMYRRSLWQQANGFKNHEHLMGGDDDLFVNQHATSANTSICLDPLSFVYSVPKKNWRSYVRQKSRHYSVSAMYQPTHIVWLGSLSTTQVLHYVGVLLLLVMGYSWLGIFLYLIRMLVLYHQLGKTVKLLNETNLYWSIWWLDALQVVYYLFMLPYLIIRNTTKWN